VVRCDILYIVKEKGVAVMLKIKDDIDLKDLEKFGVKLNHSGDYEYDVGDNRSDFVVFTVNCQEEGITKRQMAMRSGTYGDYPAYCFIDQLNILYDLIKADMVEKVEE
jgi:hypothetical protein